MKKNELIRQDEFVPTVVRVLEAILYSFVFAWVLYVIFVAMPCNNDPGCLAVIFLWIVYVPIFTIVLTLPVLYILKKSSAFKKMLQTSIAIILFSALYLLLKDNFQFIISSIFQ